MALTIADGTTTISPDTMTGRLMKHADPVENVIAPMVPGAAFKRKVKRAPLSRIETFTTYSSGTASTALSDAVTGEDNHKLLQGKFVSVEDSFGSAVWPGTDHASSIRKIIVVNVDTQLTQVGLTTGASSGDTTYMVQATWVMQNTDTTQ